MHLVPPRVLLAGWSVRGAVSHPLQGGGGARPVLLLDDLINLEFLGVFLLNGTALLAAEIWRMSDFFPALATEEQR